MSNQVAKTREFLLISDSVMANPNGDMLSDNRPRQDEKTGQAEMSGDRVKKYIKLDFVERGVSVFAEMGKDAKGNVLSNKASAQKVIKENGLKPEQLEDFMKKEFIDVRLFGGVVADYNIKLTAPLFVGWSKTVHEVEVKLIQGLSPFASGEGKKSVTFSEQYICPYALFKTVMSFNGESAFRQGLETSEEDIENFKQSLFRGMKMYRSRSKNAMPRMLVEVVYNEAYMSGRFDYVDITAVEGKYMDSIRDIADVELNLDRLEQFRQANADVIDKVVVYMHDSVTLTKPQSDYNNFTFERIR